MSPQVVLIGAPGAGKSTIGYILAQSLKCEFFDSDAIIEEQLGMSIGDIFVHKTEAFFRENEKGVVLDLLQNADGVLSLGGGSVLDVDVQQELGNHTVVWLQVSLADAVERVGLNQSRPLLLGNVRSNLKSLLSQRNHVYEKLATITIDAASSPQAIARLIMAELQVRWHA